jgi:hypothetical protein
VPFRTCIVPLADPEAGTASNENVPAMRFAVRVVTVTVPVPPANAVPQPPVELLTIPDDPLPPACRFSWNVPGAVTLAIEMTMAYGGFTDEMP